MQPAKIRSRLILKGVSQATIARSLGVSRQAVQRVIAGVDRSARIEAAVAAEIDVPPERIFPPARWRRSGEAVAS